MISLEPRWGGSLEQMQSFLAECRGANLPAARLQKLEAVIVADRAQAEYDSNRFAENPAAIVDYTAAANLGDAYSQNQLGKYSMEGVPGVVPQDLKVAIQWFTKAAAQGDSQGVKNLQTALARANGPS